jgi:hypothetical protein
MDEFAYRATRGAVNPAPCVFEKALLACGANCGLSRRQALAEREMVSCTVPVAHTNCMTFAELMRERSTFVLRLPPPEKRLPHAVGMKLQCGSLAGLAAALGATEPDVHGLLVAARERWGSLLDLPWSDIVAAVADWQIRRRHRGRENA